MNNKFSYNERKDAVETMSLLFDENNFLKELKINQLDNLSPTDTFYPMNFLANGLKIKLAQTDIIIKNITHDISNVAPIYEQFAQNAEGGVRYVVDISEKTKEAIDSGAIKLTTDKAGMMFAQIRENNGQFGAKLPIKREDFTTGIDPVQIANTLQLNALREQIEMIADQVYMIDCSVHEVLQGLQNDRLGLFYSGMALFQESRSITDADMKKALTAQALRSLSDAAFQLQRVILSDIQYLTDKEFNKAKGKSRKSLISERMESIEQSFLTIHQAMILKAGIYCDIDELPAMAIALPACLFIASNLILYENALSLGKMVERCKLLSTIKIMASSRLKSLTSAFSVSMPASSQARFLRCPLISS